MRVRDNRTGRLYRSVGDVVMQVVRKCRREGLDWHTCVQEVRSIGYPIDKEVLTLMSIEWRRTGGRFESKRE